MRAVVSPMNGSVTARAAHSWGTLIQITPDSGGSASLNDMPIYSLRSFAPNRRIHAVKRFFAATDEEAVASAQVL